MPESIYPNYRECQDCSVSWFSKDVECWLCGKNTPSKPHHWLTGHYTHSVEDIL